MDFKIENIILYPSNNLLKPRFINFEDDKINVITGYSKRGKSSIIEIIDYCLGASESNIPVGLIRDFVRVFAIKVKIDNRSYFIGRESPGYSAQNSSKMYLIEISQKGEFSELNTNEWLNNKEDFQISREQLIERLNAKAKFQNIEEKLNNEKSIRLGFRSTSSFLFQTQSIIANGNTIFYKSDSYYNIDRLRKFFPLALGYKSFEIIRLQEEIKDLESREKKLSNKLDDLKERYENWKSDLYYFYSEALELGLTEVNIDIEDSNVDIIKSEIQKIIQDARNNNLYKKGSALSFSKKIKELENKRILLTRELQDNKMELSKILNFEETKNLYLKNVSLKIDSRLKPVGWFLDRYGTDKCPFCHSKSDKALKNLQKLEDIRSENRKVIKENSTDDLSFDKEKKELKKAIKAYEDQIVEFDKNLEILINKKRQDQQTYQRIYEYVGKVSNFIQNIKFTDNEISKDLEEIRKELFIKNRTLKSLKRKYDKERVLNKVTQCIKTYIDLLPIENKVNSNVVLDPDKHLNIQVENNENQTKVFLNKIGSGSNYMCYHLATMLGLHEYFYKLGEDKKNNLIPSFLVFDQPSQVYYPENFEIVNEESDDYVNTRKIFEVCSEFMKRTNNAVQVIILEHAPKKIWEGIENIYLSENWRGSEYKKGYNALIPLEWLLND